MDKVKRSERMAVIGKILSDHPHQIYSLHTFCEMFDAAKSSISEDLSALTRFYQDYRIGTIQTLTGAAGGVKFIPYMDPEKQLAVVEGVCSRLNEPDRMLPGGFIYVQDILTETSLIEQLGMIMASRFSGEKIDFVLTVETKGIPFALMVSRALGVSLVIARRDYRVYEGPVLTINFVSATDGRMQTMSLPRRAVRSGQRALIIDDFMKGGGTLDGMYELMHEFDAEVVGAGVLMQSVMPLQESSSGERAQTLLTIEIKNGIPSVLPARWLREQVQSH
ncbi:MAG: pur operon repressor [Clostridia bacterium]|nr:pur operon repressor [Clostridia bacterium]